MVFSKQRISKNRAKHFFLKRIVVFVISDCQNIVSKKHLLRGVERLFGAEFLYKKSNSFKTDHKGKSFRCNDQTF